MTLYPNVKINLGLNVLRKREDGYHDLETLFLPYFDISDRLEIVKSDEYSHISASLLETYQSSKLSSNQISHQPPNQIVQEISEDGKLMITIARKEGVDWNPLNDLCAKAYRLLQEDFPQIPAVKIYLEKLSPVGAGLGGGSSDAAFCLCALNEMFSLSLTEAELLDYAAKLGSDCPFFILNRPMFGSGRGEILKEYYSHSINELLAANYSIEVIIPDGISVSTADAYRGIKPSLPTISLKDVLKMPIEQWKDNLKNDFEETVFAKYPSLAKVKKSLYDLGAIYASMSGSGSAFFAIFKQ